MATFVSSSAPWEALSTAHHHPAPHHVHRLLCNEHGRSTSQSTNDPGRHSHRRKLTHTTLHDNVLIV
eukprot:26188-Eustigmatos_ZCMA.PRE.1